MDALIVLLVIGGIIVSLVKKAGAKQKKSASAQTPPPTPEPREKIPFTKEEWTQYLASQKIAPKTAAKPTPPVKPAVPTTLNESLRPAAPKAQTAPIISVKPAEPDTEGFSTEGEATAEHAEHMRRMIAAETEARERRETARELRRVNRERLRAAIVLREVLDPPISVRDE